MSKIAEKMKISLAAVSQTLKEADNRVRTIIENAARMNKIRIDCLNADMGFADGYSLIFKVKTFITYSPVNGVQVWYEHKGDCEKCEKFGECRETILQELKERKIPIANETLRPTDLAEVLFKKLEEESRE